MEAFPFFNRLVKKIAGQFRGAEHCERIGSGGGDICQYKFTIIATLNEFSV